MANGDAYARAIDELYAASPEAFTKRRDELAKDLRAAGDAEGARALAALRRPTKVAYLLNQVARREAEEVTALVDLGRELARVQRRAIRGQAGPDELRETIARQREAIAGLVARARAVAAELGFDAAGTLDDVASALRTAMTDATAGAELEAGRLTRPPEIAIGLPTDDLLPAARRAPQRTRERERERAENAAAENAAREAASLRADASRAEALAAELRTTADRATSAAAEAERAARRRARLASSAERSAAVLVAKRPARRRSAWATRRRAAPSRAPASRPTSRARAGPTPTR